MSMQHIWRMKLREYRRSLGMSQAQVAAAIGAAQPDIASWEVGRRLPRPEAIAAIFEWSKGAVTPSDFYELPTLTPSTDAA